MKQKYLLFVLSIIIIFFTNSIFSKSGNLFTYISPVPNSDLNKPGTNLILKINKDANLSRFKIKHLEVIGSISGNHIGEFFKTDDDHTIIFKPYNKFTLGESVNVKLLSSNPMDKSNKSILKFEFKIGRAQANFNYMDFYRKELGVNFTNIIINNSKFPNKFSKNDTLPDDFPQISVLSDNNPAEGKIFLCNFQPDTSIQYKPYLIILDQHGTLLWHKKMQNACFDFKAQTKNLFTYYETGQYYGMDSTFKLIDSFSCGNGYYTDIHELRVMANHHALLMSYDPESVDMSQIVPGGNPNAVVEGLILQEIDTRKNVVWQWRSWDHYKITDATHENLLAASIDYVHGNAIEIASDGNILVSCRHLDEITKINYDDGSIIWRWGGKNNQFTFLNDTLKFSHQHAIRLLPNGNFTLYDNGNFHNPPFSRGVEYNLNENTKTATTVWEYRNNPSIYGFATGYVERLSNGNTLISWGITTPTLSEITPDGQKVFEMTLPTGVFTYRGFKLEPGGLTLPQDKLPAAYLLKQNYPNPFNPVTNIEYSLSQNANVKLNVYDITGKFITTLVNENEFAGRYLVQFDSGHLSSGVYFYTLIANNFKESKKLVIIK